MADHSRGVPLTAAIAVVLAPSLSAFAAVGLIPVLPQMVKAFGGNAQLVTLTVTLPLLAAAAATALLGFLGDRFSRRTIYIAAAGVFAVAAPLPVLLNTLPLILAARFLTGLAIGFMVATSLGLIGDLFTSERRSRLLSAQGIVAATLTVGGSALNGYLGQFGWHYVFLINLIGIPVFIMACTLPNRPAAAEAAESDQVVVKAPFPWRSTAVIFILVVAGILLIVPPSYELSFLFTERGIGSSVMIGTMTAVVSAGAALGAALLAPIRRLAPFFAIALCLVLSSLGQGLVVVAGTAPIPLALGVLLFGSAQGLFMALMALWLLNSIEWSVRGRVTGWFRTLIYFSGFAGPQLARLLSGALGNSENTYLAYAMMTLSLAALLAGIQMIRGRRRTATAAAELVDERA